MYVYGTCCSMSVVVTVWGLWEVCCVAAVVKDGGVLKCVVCVRYVIDVLYSDACSFSCSCIGSVSISSGRCMFVSCVHHVAVFNAAFSMTRILLMLVEYVRGDHIEEAYSRVGFMTVLYVAISVSFCLPHPVVVSAFVICSGLCACSEM